MAICVLEPNLKFSVQVESSQKGVWLLKGCLVKDVACGTRHALFCMKDGSVFACGANNRGQLGTAEETETNIPTKVTKIQHIVTKIACGSFHSVCLTGKQPLSKLIRNHNHYHKKKNIHALQMPSFIDIVYYSVSC